MSLLVVGASASPTCGLRDYATALDPWLGSPETVWWDRDPAWSAAQTGRSAKRFRRDLDKALSRRPSAVLWSYSAFDYGPRTAWGLRGIPVHVPAIASSLRRARSAVVTVVHEAAYSFTEPGAQRKGLALSQRAALAAVARASDGLVVAAPDREHWLRTRRWLPRRPITRIPICASVPRAGQVVGTHGEIAVMGFGADDACALLVTEAVQDLRERGVPARLRLVGQPGHSGPAAERWRAAAARAGCPDAVSFTGVLERARLSREIAAAPLVLFPSAAGPVAGKSTIGSVLEHGRPVVAIDGPLRWHGFGRAVALVPPTPGALARRLEHLLGDEEARGALVAAGADLYGRELAPGVTARRLRAFAEQVSA